MKKLLPALLLSTLTPLAQAEIGDVSIGLGGSLIPLTQGPGVEIGYEFSDHVDLKGIYYKGKLSGEADGDGVRYSGAIESQMTGVMLDYYPTEGRSFKMVLGAVSNGSKITGSASNVTIGANNTDVDVKISFKKPGVYLGVGYDAHFTEKFGLGFSGGMLYTGSPSVDYTASNASVDEAAEGAALEADLSVLKFLPVIKMNLFYKF